MRAGPNPPRHASLIIWHRNSKPAFGRAPTLRPNWRDWQASRPIQKPIRVATYFYVSGTQGETIPTMGRDFDPNRPRTPSQLHPLKILTYLRPCSSRALRIGMPRRRAELYATQSERGPRGGRPRREGGRPRRSRSRDFRDPGRNSRSAGSRTRRAYYVSRDFDVGPCPTHPRASASSLKGGGDARVIARGSGQVAIFAIPCENRDSRTAVLVPCVQDCTISTSGRPLRIRE